VAPAAETGLAQLEAAVAADPDNVNHRIALAKIYFDNDNLMGTFEQTKAALAKDPNEPRALTYNAIVRMAMGQNEEARTQLEKASKLEPGYLDAWVALASVRHILGDAKGAETAIESAIKSHPENEAKLREVFAQIKARKAENLPASPHANMPDPEVPVAPAPQQAAASAAPIQVTLSIGPAAMPKTGIVYVIARSEGGHPVAVKRVDAQSFPLTVDLGGADSMMGGPLPSTVRVEARLDSDGDAGTADSKEPQAAVDGVAAGSKVVLKLE
jgi:cytochrome c-type biogenesis protein CcmH